ncbi:pimeloyl-ACP methyl ester esterase BioH [Bowmanella pacifica]|uniref:Pimeloyl-[acyl-carrier protein] methyl ester esterase n=1 Tax=Bowmanella pacifica TaxID=502051 RepID=A0A917Z0G3_9ALTE|nr:pimeloyl-ACP methyl ester esterase BioH [Bowmanella pacifica]GGO71763.1 pimeloyl-[acyl-carrier protein] methyl ester esterase [Bowmanella pacifica]
MILLLHSDVVGTGPKILLLHGWGLNSEVWQPLIERLQGSFQFVLMDLPGFGHNHQSVPDSYDLDALTALVAQQLKEPMIIMGWSLGGLVAQQLALNYPALVRALICVTSTPKFLATDQWPGIKAEVLKAFAMQLRSDPHKTIERFLAIQALGSERAKADIQNLKTLLVKRPSPSKVALASGLAILEQADLCEKICTIGCPTLRIYGRNDSLVPKATLELVEHLQPKASSMLFPAASHAPFISHADEFANAIRDYLAKCLMA